MLATASAANANPSDMHATIIEKYIAMFGLCIKYINDAIVNATVPKITYKLISDTRGFKSFQSSLLPKNCDILTKAVTKRDTNTAELNTRIIFVVVNAPFTDGLILTGAAFEDIPLQVVAKIRPHFEHRTIYFVRMHFAWIWG